jgi:UDP:flavonoid glycosyltransferase YjiC (YdhE family)
VLERLGAAVALDPLTATADDVADAVRRVLDDRSYTDAAARVRAEYLALPSAADAVAEVAR